jgi:hypothetical protein
LAELKPDLISLFVSEKLEETETPFLPLTVLEPVEFGLHLENAIFILLSVYLMHDRKHRL